MTRKILLALGVIVAGLGMGAVAVCPAQEWYLRGSIGYEQCLDADFRDAHSSEALADLFGAGSGEDGKALGAYGDFGDFSMAEIALGRRIGPWLRVDVEAQYRWDMAYRGNANFLSVGEHQPVSAPAKSLCALAAVFWDLMRLGPVQPYIGAGIGLAVNHVDEMTYRFPDNTGSHKISLIPAGNRTDTAYMVTLGTGFALTDSMILDVAYRYQDSGKIVTDPGKMVMDVLPEGIDIDETSAPLRTRGITAGLRFRF